MATWRYINESMLLDSDGRAILERYRCPRCKQLLRNAVQPSCGHWLCKEPCARELFNSSSPPTCPRLDCMEELTAEAGMEYFPDPFVRKEIHNLRVRCYCHDKGCSWRGNLKDLEYHFKQCQFSTEECKFCGQAIHLLEMSTHMPTCRPLSGQGRTAGGRSEQQEYYSLLGTVFTELKTPKPDRPAVLENADKEEEDEERRCDYDSGYGVSNSRKKGSCMITCQEETSKSGMAMLVVMPLVHSSQGQDLAERGLVCPLCNNVRAPQAELAESKSSFNGTMVWKIPQFEQQKSDAKSGKCTSIFSLPFYTDQYGYKMCLRLYILGDGAGKNTHMSLFFVIMQNEFDNVLQWPFNHRVTFKLINQRGGRDIIDTFQPDPTSSSFRKPKSDMNIASGCPKFVSHQELKNEFIVDDTIFIKCSVDLSTIRAI